MYTFRFYCSSCEKLELFLFNGTELICDGCRVTMPVEKGLKQSRYRHVTEMVRLMEKLPLPDDDRSVMMAIWDLLLDSRYEDAQKRADQAMVRKPGVSRSSRFFSMVLYCRAIALCMLPLPVVEDREEAARNPGILQRLQTTALRARVRGIYLAMKAGWKRSVYHQSQITLLARLVNTQACWYSFQMLNTLLRFPREMSADGYFLAAARMADLAENMRQRAQIWQSAENLKDDDPVELDRLWREIVQCREMEAAHVLWERACRYSSRMKDPEDSARMLHHSYENAVCLIEQPSRYLFWSEANPKMRHLLLSNFFRGSQLRIRMARELLEKAEQDPVLAGYVDTDGLEQGIRESKGHLRTLLEVGYELEEPMDLSDAIVDEEFNAYFLL